MKRREELPFFKQLPYTFDVDRIIADFDLIKDKNDDEHMGATVVDQKPTKRLLEKLQEWSEL